MKLADSLNDDYFKRAQDKTQKKKQEGEIFVQAKSSYTVTDQRKADQKSVDASLVAAIKKSKDAKFLKAYLATPFSIGKADRPHQLIF